jgi:hypothetical protein
MIDVRLTGRAWSRFLAGVARTDWGTLYWKPMTKGAQPACIVLQEAKSTRPWRRGDIVSRS